MALDIYPRGSAVADRKLLVVLGSQAAREGVRGCDRGGAEGYATSCAAFPHQAWGTSYSGYSAGADFVPDFAPVPASAPVAPA